MVLIAFLSMNLHILETVIVIKSTRLMPKKIYKTRVFGVFFSLYEYFFGHGNAEDMRELIVLKIHYYKHAININNLILLF